METLFLVGQIVLGLYFIAAGAMHFAKMNDMVGYATMKGAPMPRISVPFSGLVLLLGGLGTLFQYQTAIAYWALIGFLVVAAVMMHNFWKVKDPMAKMGDMVNFQKNLALAAALLMLLVNAS